MTKQNNARLRSLVLAVTVSCAAMNASADESVMRDDRPQAIGTLAAAHGAQATNENATDKVPPEALGAPGADIPSTRNSSTTASSVEGKERDFGTSTGAATASSGTATDRIERADSMRMVEMAYANIAEITAGALALDDAESLEVKQFAQRMITDHQKFMAELTRLAKLHNVRLPEQPDPQHQSAMMKMKLLSGPGFDEAYIEQMVTDHHNLLRKLRSISEDAQNKQLQIMAATMIPVVQEHMWAAERLAGNAIIFAEPDNMQRNVPPAAR
jgi:putative membrane protein